MEHAGHQPLAGAGLALEQHRRDGGITQGIKGREVPELGAQGHDGRTRPDEALSGMARRLWGRMVHRILLWLLTADDAWLAPRLAPGVAPGATPGAPLCMRPTGKASEISRRNKDFHASYTVARLLRIGL